MVLLFSHNAVTVSQFLDVGNVFILVRYFHLKPAILNNSQVSLYIKEPNKLSCLYTNLEITERIIKPGWKIPEWVTSEHHTSKLESQTKYLHGMYYADFFLFYF